MFSIGEFSRVAGLSIKALRLYHEQGILVPSHVDQETGYRYYGKEMVERARTVALLRELHFPLEAIKGMLGQAGDDQDVLPFLESHRSKLEAQMRELKLASQAIDRVITAEKAALDLAVNGEEAVHERVVEPLLIAGIRTKGPYEACSQVFAQLGRKVGRHIAGPPLNLYYDAEYKDGDADFESCFPVRRKVAVDGVACRDLPGGRLISVMHKGPYQGLGRSYAKLFDHVSRRGYQTQLPSREVYVKGPGMIFKGNPNRYLTEIQLLVAEG